ncbi:hypothetical protein B0H14DRAFT_2644145 [Mycena olivaceomarginata]|nr:hypothetical protein B0H14DRAFT_2644145 [Mycena olivaceomarginata]
MSSFRLKSAHTVDDADRVSTSPKDLIRRYHFNYPKIDTVESPKLSSLFFWNSLASSNTLVFSELICRIHHPKYKPVEQNIVELLNKVLPELRFALSLIDLLKNVPKDITLALAGLDRVPEEYTYLILPEIGQYRYFPVDARPPAPKHGPTDDKLRDAPYFSRCACIPAQARRVATTVKPAPKHLCSDSSGDESGDLPAPAELTRRAWRPHSSKFLEFSGVLDVHPPTPMHGAPTHRAKTTAKPAPKRLRSSSSDNKSGDLSAPAEPAKHRRSKRLS